MSALARVRRSAAEFLYGHLRHAKDLQQRIDSHQDETQKLKAEVAAQIGSRTAEGQLFRARLHQSFVMHRNFHDATMPIVIAESAGGAEQSDALLGRIQLAYRAADAIDEENGLSFWTGDYAEKKRAEREALMSPDVAALRGLFADPLNSAIFYGFDMLNRIDTSAAHIGHIPWRTEWVYDNLLRLAEAIGVQRIEYPETGDQPVYPDPEELLLKLDAAFGFKIDFPNPYAGETGLQTSRGIASYRAIQALYQAWLIKNTGAETVVEIGAGMGRTAYYALKFGVREYTLVDLPMTNVPQAHFLGSALGPQSVSLFGENTSAPVKIIPPAPFLASADTYDLIINVDSMTEMSREYATQYFEAAAKRSGALLSINHEHNNFTVREIAGDRKSVYRTHYWLRRGYVEELFSFKAG